MKRTLLLNIAVLLLTISAAEGADWLSFLENDNGDKLFVDMDSIRRTSPDTVRLQKKVVPGGSSDIDALVSDIVMDCKRRQIKYLTETTHFKNGKTAAHAQGRGFRQITGKDIDESLLELVCSLKKK